MKNLLPALWPENYPYSVLESFMSQRPVIATNLGGLVEMVEHLETGLVVRPNNINELANKIVWAIEHPKKVNLMGKSAQKKVIFLCNSESHYKQLMNIYGKIINS